MTLFRFFLSVSSTLVSCIVLVGFFNGLCSVAVLALINRRLNHPEAFPATFALAFLGLIVAKLMSSAVSESLMVRFGQGSILKLLDRLSRAVVHTPLRQLERIGSARILSVLIGDVGTLTEALNVLPSIVINSAIMLGCGIYLAWLSLPAFLGIIVVMVVGFVTHKLVMTHAYQYFRGIRNGRDTLFGHFRAVTEGIKELKLHRGRRDTFFEREMATTIDQLRRDSIAGNDWYIAGRNSSYGFFYLLLALLLFGVPVVGRLPHEALTGYVFACLYLMAPMSELLKLLPVLGQGRIALQKVDECKVSIAADTPPQEAGVGREVSPLWARLQLSGVMFHYGANEAANGSFMLGPIDLTLHRNEVTFVVGGNGSGKSTFVKVLTGLYVPAAGEIRCDGELVTDSNREWYRQHFSAVFTDFYLFCTLLGLEGPDIHDRAREYLTRLQLDHKVQIVEGRFSTTELSQGQRKRLALLTAYLEDRPICVFDEWAADQDPTYKDVFYRELLPELKARGKAVVVITHDDRYFHLGDRVVKLDYGRVVDEVKTTGERVGATLSSRLAV